MLGLELPTLGQHLQNQGCGRKRETETDQERGGGLQAEEPGATAKQQCAQQHLGRAEPEDDAPHDPKARRLQFKADDEQQQHDAELGDVHDLADIAEQAQSPRADDETRRHVAEDRAEFEQPEQCDGDDGGREQDCSLRK